MTPKALSALVVALAVAIGSVPATAQGPIKIGASLSLTGTLTLLYSIVLGYQVPAQASVLKSHFLIALLSTTLLVMAHSFIMFFLIATGVEMKEMEQAAGWGDSFRRRTIKMKGQVFPAMTFAILLVIANFILGAAIHTRALPARVHEVTAWLTPMSVPRLVMAIATRGRASTAATRLRRLVQVTQKRSFRTT